MRYASTDVGGKRRHGVATWVAVTALVSASAVVATAGPAGAARAKTGKLQVCVASARTQTATYVVHRTGWTKTFAMRSVAGHTTCSGTMTVRTGTYKILQKTPKGMRVTSVSVSPSARTLARSTAGSWARAGVIAKHLTRITFRNAVIVTPPAKPKPPAPIPPATPKPPAPIPPTAPSDPGTGYLEVCKQAGDGYVTGNVTVSITAGSFSASQIVPVGQCTQPIQVPVGTATVSETVPAPYYLADVKTSPVSALVSKNLPGLSAQVKVAASTDGSTETLVTLINATQLAKFKVCKTLESNAQDLIDTGHNAFVFDVSYTALNSAPFSTKLSVIVPSLGQGACVLYPIALPLGTKVTVTEEKPWSAEVTGVSVLPASQDAGSAGTSAVFTIGPSVDGVTSAMFVNRADGTIEVCKRIDNGWLAKADSMLVGSADGWSPYNGYAFKFSINGGDPITVLAGQCSRPITVPAGTATVEELATDFFNLVGFTATGPDQSSRLLSGTNPITVAVPAGGVGNETLVVATDRVQTGQVKVCKMLDPNVPVGKTYTFVTKFGMDQRSFIGFIDLTPTATGPDGEVCSYLSASLPVIDPAGHALTFTTTEGPSPFGLTEGGALIVEPTVISYDGNGIPGASKVWSPGDTKADDGTYYGSATVGQGVNVLTFVNSLVLDP